MRKFLVFVFLLALFICSALYLSQNPARTVSAEVLAQDEVTGELILNPNQSEKKLAVSFSEKDHFYREDIEVSITANFPDAEIYYTTDGSEPTREAAVYSKPILLDAGGGVKSVVLKAIAVNGGSETKPLVHTYFLGRGVETRFNTLVFSLSTDEKNLYDYDTGIFVLGRIRDEYIAENPDVLIEPPAPANFNLRGMESERPVHVEVLTHNGERVLSQAAGMRVSGGWSRATDQKSLRLVARKEYDADNGKFHYNFFPEERSADKYQTPILEYDQIVLRNGANDREFGMLRNEVTSSLARDAGFRIASPARAAAVFLNGEYYGFTWVQVQINEKYLQDIYRTPTDEFEIVGDGEGWYNTEDEYLEAEVRQMEDYAYKNLTDDAVFNEFTKLVDIDNLLFYYAFEIYTGNNDWPKNNMKRWRYVGPKLEGMPPELDGRWRYVIYDVDWTLGLYGGEYTDASFAEVIASEKERNSPLLTALLARRDMRSKFAAIICDLAANVVTEEKVTGKINKFYSEAAQEIKISLEENKYADWVGEWNVWGNHEGMKAFAKGRSITAFEFLKENYGYEQMFEIGVTGGHAKINGRVTSRAKYFNGINAQVSPELPKFTEFDHWLVNGNKVKDENLTLSWNDTVNGKIGLELVTKDNMPKFCFDTAHSNRNSNGCILINLTDTEQSTLGLYLSDNPSQLKKYALTEVFAKPGETVALTGKGTSDYADLLNIQLTFRVESGEILFLSDIEGNVLDYIHV